MRNFVLSLLCVACLAGCGSSNLTMGWYAVEAVGYTGYDRYKRSDDAVLIKGIKGEPNLLF